LDTVTSLPLDDDDDENKTIMQDEGMDDDEDAVNTGAESADEEEDLNEQHGESEDDGMAWESMKYSEGDAVPESPQSKIFKRSYYVGRSTVGAARKARQTAGLDDKFPLTEPLLQEFHDFLQSTTAAVTNTNNMVSYSVCVTSISF
jgi:hypothetical protein